MPPVSLRATEPAAEAPATRRRLLDNPRLIGIAVLVLLSALTLLFFLATRTDQLRPEFVTNVGVYMVSPLIIALLAALVFVLGRNILKLWVDRRQALPFARFRAKLVAALLAMTIVPSVLVLLIGSEMINSSAQRWFSTPADELVKGANDIAQIVYADRASLAIARAERLASALTPAVVASGDIAVLQPALMSEVASTSTGMVELYRVTATSAGAAPETVFVTSVGESSMPRSHATASADRLAARVVASNRAVKLDDEIADVILIRAGAPVRGANGAVTGVVIASEAMSAQVSSVARRMTDAYSQYQQLKTLRGPLQGFYLSVFLAVTLLILISATWFGLFVAKRITRPVQMLAEGARAVGAGQLDLRIEPDSTDELGSLVESFNTMAAELRTSHERLDARRRYIETILERVATGVVSLSADGHVQTVNRAAEKLLGLDETAIGKPAGEVFAREDLASLLPVIHAAANGQAGLIEEITLVREEREIHMAVASTMLVADGGASEGAVVVLDDVTPLIRAQRVAAWRDVARRLAHEIKNPLTPIQLSAERLQRNFATAPPNARALVDECSSAIITEVEVLKGLVDEFAQFARMRGPKLVPADLNLLATDTVRLYRGVLQQGTIDLVHESTSASPQVRMDPEQMRQVLINLVDNAIDALGGASAGARPNGDRPSVRLTVSPVPFSGMVRFTVADNGPGIPLADREKLFLPYYSTKGRGSGLGLAIVRRIITEHGGTVTVGESASHGAIFTVELPAA